MKRILFPVVQDISIMLIPTLINLASSLDAEIHVLHVTPPTDAFIKSRMVTARRWVKSFVEEHFTGVCVRIAEVTPGDPAEEIRKYAEDNGMDLIVMGTHGRKGIGRFYFGHVAEDVVAQSTIPVITINVPNAKDIKFI